MEKNLKRYRAYVRILEEELVPAMGCTEPIALAYGAAVCREVLGRIPDEVAVKASGSIIKNVKSVIVPNTGHLKGIEAAAAAGIIAGDAGRKLEVISQVSKDKLKEIACYLEKVKIQVDFLNTGLTFDIVVTERCSTGESATVRIANYHTNLVYIEKNGQVLKNLEADREKESSLEGRSLLDMHHIWDFAMTCDIEDVREILERQIACNMAISEEGLRADYGANIGRVMLEAYGNTPDNRAAALAAAGSDARMYGCEMPVIINSGSGNQGITCSVPVVEYARQTQAGEEKTFRALVLSNLTAIYQKTGIGRLSAFCGAVCAGVAAGGGIAYLKGGGEEEFLHTVVNGLAVVSGMVCDGAKPSCAAKIAMAVKAGLLGYDMFVRGQQFYGGDGILTKGADNTIENIGRLGREGMRETNEEIIRIMLGQGV